MCPSPFFQKRRIQMAMIKDSTGYEWELRLTLSAIRKICAKMNITMAQLTSLDLPLDDILGSIHHLCEKELKEKKVSVDEFYERIDEVSFDVLLKTLQETLYEAFPKMKPQAEGDSEVPFAPGS